MNCEEVRALIQTYAHRTGTRDGRNVTMYTALVTNLLDLYHPTWRNRADEITAVRVTRNPAGKSLLLQIKRIEQSRWLTVSWKDCVTKTTTGRDRKAPVERNRLEGAMRFAVRRQTQSWGRTNAAGAVCVTCAATAKLQVDHTDPPFVVISQAFLAKYTTTNTITTATTTTNTITTNTTNNTTNTTTTNTTNNTTNTTTTNTTNNNNTTTNTIPDRFDTCRRTCQPRFRRTDVEFTRAWQRYHLRRARYQWLCPSCNARKGARLF
jgi:hypothetical protein